VRNVLDQLAMLIESEDDALLRARLEASLKRRMESFQ
jgi:hypothetical protein